MTTPTRTRAALAGAFLSVLALTQTAAARDGDDPDQLFKQGRWEDAVAAYEKVAAAEPENQQAWFRLGYALHALGRMEAAVRAHERAAGLTGPATVTAGFNAACAHARLGNADKAQAWLGRAIGGGFASVSAIDTDPDLDSVRDDDGFVAHRNGLAAKTLYRSLRPATRKGARDQFDFWVGDWDTVNFSRTGAGPWTPTGALESRVFKVLGGRALVEWSRATQPGAPAHGFSLRTFDEKKDEWIVLLNWPAKDRPSFSVLTGRFRHARCELVTPLYGAGGAGQTRFTFSDVSSGRYLWDSASTADGGNTWRSTLLFEGTRRAPDAAPLATGPSRSDAHCSGPSFRALDFRLGRWSGTRRTRVADDRWEEAPVELHCYSVMGGSAVVDEWVVGSGEKRRATFAIQSFEPARGKWVRYALDDGSPHFRRFEGTAGDAGCELVGARGPGSSGAPGSLLFERGDDGALRTIRRDGKRVLWKHELRAVK